MEEETAEPPREKQGGDTEEAEKKGKGKEMKEMMKAKKTEQRKNQDEDQYSWTETQTVTSKNEAAALKIPWWRKFRKVCKNVNGKHLDNDTNKDQHPH